MVHKTRMIRLGFVLMSLLAAACVTINIYFPAAEAREAAEQIVEDVLGATGEKKPAVKLKQGEPQSRTESGRTFIRNWNPLDLLIPAAHAAQPDFNVDTPEIRSLQASMKNRNPSLQPFYESGAIGFTRNALVALRDAGTLSLKDRARVQALVDAENRDRNALYQAIARANGHPEWEGQVRSVFADTWISKAERGWWYQNAQGQWQHK